MRPRCTVCGLELMETEMFNYYDPPLRCNTCRNDDFRKGILRPPILERPFVKR